MQPIYFFIVFLVGRVGYENIYLIFLSFFRSLGTEGTGSTGVPRHNGREPRILEERVVPSHPRHPKRVRLQDRHHPRRDGDLLQPQGKFF